MTNVFRSIGRRGRHAAAAGGFVLVVAGIAGPAHAVDYFWNAPSGGLFRTPANWTPLSAPFLIGPGGPNDFVHFDIGDTYAVDQVFGQNAVLDVDADTVTLNLAADYTLTGNQSVIGSLQVGDSDGLTGSLTLAGNGSAVFRTTQSVFISTARGAGIVTVKNLNWIASDLMFVGELGTGTLDVRNAATVSGPHFDVGGFEGSKGFVSVSGTGSALTADQLFVGGQGTGAVSVSAGGALATTVAVVDDGESFTSAVTLTGGASTWHTDSLYIGGNMTTSGGNGVVTVTGGSALTVTSTLRIYAHGILELDSGTLSTPSFTNSGGQFAWTGGTLHLTGAAGLEVGVTPFFTSSVALGPAQNLQVDKALKVDAGKSLFAGGGLTVGSANVVAGGQLFSASAAPKFGTGLVNNGDVIFTAPATVDGPVTNNAGARITALANVTFADPVTGSGKFFGAGKVTFAAGFSPADNAAAVVPFEGAVTLATGSTLSIELAGISPAQFDELDVAGDFSIGGSLDVELLNGLQLQPNERFVIADVTGIRSGTFAGLSEGARVGTFNGMDLFITYAGGDGNDVALFTAVPEPATACGLLPVLAGMLLTKRRRRR